MEPIKRSLPSEIGGSGKLLRGLIPYNSPTLITERGRTFTEVIRPGAFIRAGQAPRDVVSTFNHSLDRLLGRTSSGTLRLTETPAGLAYEVDLPEAAADVRELLARGDLKGSSFTAFARKDGEKWSKDVRELTGLDLVEVGPVVLPAYPDSSASIRSAEAAPASAGRRALALLGLMARS